MNLKVYIIAFTIGKSKKRNDILRVIDLIESIGLIHTDGLFVFLLNYSKPFLN